MKKAGASQEIGETRNFVLASGFIQVASFDALIGDDNTRRLFAEFTANTDRPDVRPAEAYHAMLTSIQPGWTIRLMQIFWPDPAPREAFYQQVSAWQRRDTEGLNILNEGLLLAVGQTGLPFTRRTILEFVLPGDEGLSWWESLPEMCLTYGVTATRLTKDQIQNLAHWIFNPTLE